MKLHGTRLALALMFSGPTANAADNLDCLEWVNRGSVPGLVARTNHAAAYDRDFQHIVLFGGRDASGNRLADTWVYDGDWQNVTPSGSPSAREGHDMVWSPDYGLIMHGGLTDSGVTGETWRWDGLAWIPLPSGPPRFDHSLFYDELAGSVLFQGGLVNDFFIASDETWRFDLTTWTLRFSGNPGRRWGHDVVSGRSSFPTPHLYGGWTDADMAFTITDHNWFLFADEFPYSWRGPSSGEAGVRFDHAMARHDGFDCVLMYGGSGPTPLGDLWVRDTPSGWIDQGTQSPGVRTGHTFTYYPPDGSMILFGGDPSITDGNVWEFQNDLNDYCHQAWPISEGSTNVDLECATTDGPAHPGFFETGNQIEDDVWFRYTASCDGNVTITGDESLLRMALYEDHACKVGLPRLIGVSDGATYLQTSITVTVSAGDKFLLRVGSRTGALNSAAVDISCDATVDCPPLRSPPYINSYAVVGPGTGSPWTWRISSASGEFADFVGSVPGVTGTALDVASEFANSINIAAIARGCDADSTGGHPPIEIAARVFDHTTPILSIVAGSSANDAQLYVGPSPGLANCRVVTSLPACSFNPTIAHEDLPGIDCNNNWIDDVIDIESGTSEDVDGNGVPDECEVVSVDSGPLTASALWLPEPNPMRTHTRITWQLDAPARSSVRVFDASGRLVRTLLTDEIRGSGNHVARWDGRNDRGAQVSTGIYFVELRAGARRETKKLIVQR